MDVSAFWNEKWSQRIKPSGRVAMNGEKRRLILRELKARPQLDPLKKLEIGCGPAVHAGLMERERPGWSKNYLGIDVAQSAVDFAREVVNVDARLLNVFELDEKEFNGFQLFLFLDSLEHIMDHKRLADKVKALADDDFVLFGNIPLYTQPEALEAESERPVDINALNHFVYRCGGKEFYHYIYGVLGYPYLFWTAEIHRVAA